MMQNRLSDVDLKKLSEATFRKTRDVGWEHALYNKPYMKKTIKDLQIDHEKVKRGAIVIAAGPSLHRNGQLQMLRASDFRGLVIACDGAMYACLRHGVVPDYVLTVDPHKDRIVRNLGDPHLSEQPEDDYFRRSDLDPAFHRDEIERNRDLVNLVDAHVPNYKMIISTSASPKVTERCREAGMDMYWWNPIYDDYDEEKSFTKELYRLNKAPCMATGGNVGTSSYVFAVGVLGAKDVALLGMDLSYHRDTPLLNTQYYYEIKEIFGEDAEKAFIRVFNPHLNEEWYADPTYYWYRECFLKLAAQVDDVRTYNCTQGGILFGGNVVFAPFSTFLQRHSGEA